MYTRHALRRLTIEHVLSIDSDMNDSPGDGFGGAAPSGRPLDHQQMMELGKRVQDAARTAPISCDAIDKLADTLGVTASALYASAAAIGDVEIERKHKVTFVVCTGSCRDKGALDHLQHLVEERKRRRKKWFKKAFDIEARSCLNRCDHAPVIRLHLREGVAFLERTTTDVLNDAIKETCG